jgi:hypothetical protein
LNCLHDLDFSSKTNILNFKYSLVNTNSIEDLESNLIYQLSLYIENEISSTELVYNEVNKIYKNMIIPKIDTVSETNAAVFTSQHSIDKNPLPLVPQLTSNSTIISTSSDKIHNFIPKQNLLNKSSSSSSLLQKNNEDNFNINNQSIKSTLIKSSNNHSPLLKQKPINKLFQPIQQHNNNVSKIPNNCQQARVVRQGGATVRDNIDIDNSNILFK